MSQHDQDAQFAWGNDTASIYAQHCPAAVEGIQINSTKAGSLTIEVGHWSIAIDLLKGEASASL